MRLASITTAVLLMGVVVSTALAEESRYPGTKPLVVGKYTTIVGQNFAFMERCDGDFNYKAFLDRLRGLSKADWKYFISLGASVRGYDGVRGCNRENNELTKKHLIRYERQVIHLVKLCEGKEVCRHAGWKWE